MAAKNSAESPGATKDATAAIDTSDQALARLLNRVKAAADPEEISKLTRQIEQIVFHKQFENA